MKIRLPIDTKSLYFNILNDNKTGHTPTVATPLTKKCGDYSLSDILSVDCQIDISNKPDLTELLIKGSKSLVKINNVYVFDNISVNGKKIDIPCSFGCYIKEEIDETKVQFGRKKVHYPSKFVYEDLDINVNNKVVFERIKIFLKDYAFIIRAFTYDFETKTLDFDALIVGEHNIPYSKVFKIEKGTGSKFNKIFNEVADDYDLEIINLRKFYGDDVVPNNYLDYVEKNKIIALNIVKAYLKTSIELISVEFPYSLYDFIYEKDNIRKYGILRVTTTNDKYFNLSNIQEQFMCDYSNDVNIFLVSGLLTEEVLSTYSYDSLFELGRLINSIKYKEVTNE